MSNVHQFRAKELFEGFEKLFAGKAQEDSVELCPFPRELSEQELRRWNGIVLRYWREFCSCGVVDWQNQERRCGYWMRMLEESAKAGYIFNPEFRHVTHE